jgi:tRNA (cytidine/uridine-2'-O-)-methyltransferase
MLAVETGGAMRYSDMHYRRGDALLFGPESRGLPPGVVGHSSSGGSLSIPMRPANRSLNLANAVALVVYEAWRQLDFAI